MGILRGILLLVTPTSHDDIQLEIVYAYFILKPPAARDIVHTVSPTQDARKLARQSPGSSQARKIDRASQARQDSQGRRLASSANWGLAGSAAHMADHMAATVEPCASHMAKTPHRPLLYRSCIIPVTDAILMPQMAWIAHMDHRLLNLADITCIEPTWCPSMHTTILA